MCEDERACSHYASAMGPHAAQLLGTASADQQTRCLALPPGLHCGYRACGCREGPRGLGTARTRRRVLLRRAALQRCRSRSETPTAGPLPASPEPADDCTTPKKEPRRRREHPARKVQNDQEHKCAEGQRRECTEVEEISNTSCAAVQTEQERTCADEKSESAQRSRSS